MSEPTRVQDHVRACKPSGHVETRSFKTDLLLRPLVILLLTLNFVIHTMVVIIISQERAKPGPLRAFSRLDQANTES